MLKHGFIIYCLLILKYISTEECPEPSTKILQAVPLADNEENQVQASKKLHIQGPNLNGDELNTQINLLPQDMLHDQPIPDLLVNFKNPSAHENTNWIFRNIMPYPYMTAGIPLKFPVFDQSQIYESADSVPINRIERTLSDDDDVLWDELEQEAVMHNVLPIMPAPYFRSSQGQGMPYSQGQGMPYSFPIAAFPYKVSDCAIPILVSCSPQITRGRMSGNKVAVPIKYDFPKN